MALSVNRLAVRLGAAALSVAGALALSAAPAQAARGVDLSVSIAGNGVAAGSVLKPIKIKITNLGGRTANGFQLDLESIADSTRLAIDLPPELVEVCTAVSTFRAECAFENGLTKNESFEVQVMARRLGDDPGVAGLVQATVHSDQDAATTGNNTARTVVRVTRPGIDIAAMADDALAGHDEATDEILREIAPGGTGTIPVLVANFGSVAAENIRFEVRLPKYVTINFDITSEPCVISADKRRLSCLDSSAPLGPEAGLQAIVRIKVAENAPGPVNLTGVFEASAQPVAADAPAAAAAGQARRGSALQRVNLDSDSRRGEIDRSDNTDSFVVFVGAAA